MPIPDVETILLPLLRLCANGQNHSIRELTDLISDDFALSDGERNERLNNGKRLIANRVGWARTYLKKAGLVEYPTPGATEVTAGGRTLLAENPTSLDFRSLKRSGLLDEIRPAWPADMLASCRPDSTSGNENTPEEELERAYSRIRSKLAADILDTIKSCSPEFFERLVVELLVAMGYGGSRADAGERLGSYGDGGIDGTIKEDKLGLDVIYIQAKRWDSTPVGRPEIQKFVGALQGQRARKGVFLTTATYTREAMDYAANLDTKVILIDGERLAQLMIDHDLGVSTAATYTLKRVDSDYFAEEQ